MLATGKMLLLSMVFAIAGLALGLFLVVPWPTGIDADELDFGTNSGASAGSGQFSKFVPRDDRVLIGKVPVGIRNLSIDLTAKSDLDIELWDGEVFVAGWEAGGRRALIYGEGETKGEYNGVIITWSGWGGIDGKAGNERITVSGITKNTFVMKAFGYNAGSVRVEYSWSGTGLDGPASSGAGRFSKLVPQNGRVVIGTIPAGVDSPEINLTATRDLDIELWDDDIFVIGWQVNGKKSLIYHSAPATGLYRGVEIAWSGWDGVDGDKGSEYIRISGTTQNSFLMKVFGYQEGDVTVDYRWGLDQTSPSPEPTPTPTPTPSPAPTPTPAPASTPSPAPVLISQQPAQAVRTWAGGFNGLWSEPTNWFPLGTPVGDELVVIEGSLSEAHAPIMNIDFTLTTGSLTIGPDNTMLTVREEVTFTNHGTVNAKGNIINEGTIVNTGVFQNYAALSSVSGSGGFANQVDGALNNYLSGTGDGKIINACGGKVRDLGELGPVEPAPCLWSGAGGNDNWSNPANWVNGLVPPVEHPVVINGEGSAAAKVQLDVDLVIRSRSLTLGSGDSLTIGDGSPFGKGNVSLEIEKPGGLLINRGTINVSNFSSFDRDPLATIDNVAGAVKIACRGSGPAGGVTGAASVQNPCFWDGEGSTNNWSEIANWDSNSAPQPGDPILVRDADGQTSVVNLDRSFELNPKGSITVAGGQTLNIVEGVTLSIADRSPGGAIWIDGTLNLNKGTLHNQSTGLITNRGTINVLGGTLKNEGDNLVNRPAANINNIGGVISNSVGAWFSNSGAVLNDSVSSFILGDHSTLSNDGTFTNHGLFNTSTLSGNIVNRATGAIVNSGTFNQGGLGVFSNQAGSKLTNSGRFNVFDSLLDNRGTVDNSGTMEVFHFGSYQNKGGQLDNQTDGSFTNAGSAANLENSTINNSGVIINDRNLVNAGTMTNLCGGSVTGPVNGNQPAAVCSIN